MSYNLIELWSYVARYLLGWKMQNQPTRHTPENRVTVHTTVEATTNAYTNVTRDARENRRDKMVTVLVKVKKR